MSKGRQLLYDIMVAFDQCGLPGFQNKEISRPLFTIISRPKSIILDTDSILRVQTMVFLQPYNLLIEVCLGKKDCFYPRLVYQVSHLLSSFVFPSNDSVYVSFLFLLHFRKKTHFCATERLHLRLT